MNITSWGGTWTDATREFYTDPFSEETGVSVNFLETGGDQTAFVLLQAQQGSMTVDADVLAAGYIAMARLRQAQADPAGALYTLRQFLDIAREREIAEHLVARGRATQALLALQQGALETAVDWAERSGLRPEDTLSYLREWEYLTLARVRIAQAQGSGASPYLPDARHILDRLLQDAEAGRRVDSVIRILILLALLPQARHDAQEAHTVLNRALTLAAPEGYVRVFVDAGAPLAELLAQSAARRAQSDPIRAYAEHLLSAFRAGQHLETAHTSGAPPVLRSPLERSNTLIEPLTDREREVMRLRYGLGTDRAHTLEEVGRRLAITRERVRQIEAKAVAKMRAGRAA